jgi:hypothetical protein
MLASAFTIGSPFRVNDLISAAAVQDFEAQITERPDTWCLTAWPDSDGKHTWIARVDGLSESDISALREKTLHGSLPGKFDYSPMAEDLQLPPELRFKVVVRRKHRIRPSPYLWEAMEIHDVKFMRGAWQDVRESIKRAILIRDLPWTFNVEKVTTGPRAGAKPPWWFVQRIR